MLLNFAYLICMNILVHKPVFESFAFSTTDGANFNIAKILEKSETKRQREFSHRNKSVNNFNTKY